MMYVSLHCVDTTATSEVLWYRPQPQGGGVGGREYLVAKVNTENGEVSLFLSPDQALELAARLHTVCQDRDVVLAEEAAKAGPHEMARGAEEGVVKGGDGPVRQTWQFGHRES